MKKLFAIRTLSLAAAVLLAISTAKAGEVDAHKRMQSTSSFTVIPTTADSVHLSPSTGNFTDSSVVDLLTFGYDHANINYIPGFDATVQIGVQPYDASMTPLTPFTATLSVSYQPYDRSKQYIDKAAYKFSGAYKFRFTVNSITINGSSASSLPTWLYIDGDISAQRFYNYSLASDTVIAVNPPAANDLDCDSITDEIEISWTTVDWAEEYQVEWTFVNDYGLTTGTYISASALEFEMKNNSTRISTSNGYYKITYAFEHGYLLYRVRGIGRDHSDPTKIITGPWNLPDRGIVGSQPANNKFAVTDVHEGDKNWTFTGTFAEEGKKREVVSYFDGSLRSRQTVTKNNSDLNTLVSQTIYDHQGRPAVTVLPSPVALGCNGGETAIKYYPLFNRNSDDSLYSRSDFDLDNDSCLVSVGVMSESSGASNYFSPANPDKSGHQAFVPDANQYPFSQVEYTPDNTGRIRRQGGVGPEFQLGSGHETKYYYGQPNQIQLDRLFGSEVGDASHYKKNLVVDPNGQISVTYLDQQGRTIATALAGTSPENVEKLISDSLATKEFTVDLFSKNATGKTNLNTTNPESDALVFNSQLLVTLAGTHYFNYNITVDTLSDACLRDTVCFGCVYNMELKVIDECGVDKAADYYGGLVTKIIGHIDTTEAGDLVFSTQCTNPTQVTDTTALPLYLSPGNYTVSKVLRINPDARAFYVNAYLDSLNNSCFKTRSEFIDEALAALDTSGCNIGCAECAASLGERDSMISSGAMSDLEYDALMEQCLKPCKQLSWCEVIYDQLLLDVSPTGQYAQYIDNAGAANPSAFPLSVLNSGNSLPANIVTYTGSWRKPLVTVNGNNYNYYLNDDGTRSKIEIVPTQTAGAFLPAVEGGKEFYDSVSGKWYAYPENLFYIQDFVNKWQTSWAKSLVQFHPEYCYYKNCKEYSVKYPDEHLTVDAFDQKLLGAETFAEAVADSLIKGNYASFSDPNDRIQNFFARSSTHPYDPFIISSGSHYQQSYLNFNINSEFSAKFNNYLTVGSSTFTMLEAAAIFSRCGALYNVVPNSACQNFGIDYTSDPATNDSIRNNEWRLFRSFYISEKYRLQKRRADDYAREECDGYNGCIGNESYNPFASGMTAGSFLSSPYFDQQQPCGIFTQHYYTGKQKRFPDYADVSPLNAADAGYQLFLQTGQCPLAKQFQGFLDAFAEQQLLTSATPVDLTLHPEFSYDMYYAITDTSITDSVFVHYQLRVITTGDTLNAEIQDAADSTSRCNFRLIKTGTGITDWDDVLGIKNIISTGFSGGYYHFTASALIKVDTGGFYQYVYKTIKGYTCIKLNGCTFPYKCEPSEFAKDIQDLMSALAANGQLTGTSVGLSDSPYGGFVTDIIINTLGAPDNDLIWNFVSPNKFDLYHSSSSSNKIRFEFNSGTFTTLSLIESFNNINSNYQHYFTVTADTSGVPLYNIEGNATRINGSQVTGLSMGNCGRPDPLNCNDPSQRVRKELEALLKEVLTNPAFDGNADLTKSPAYTDFLASYFGTGVTSTSSYITDSVYGGFHYDTLHFVIPNCNMYLTHRDNNSPARTFTDLVNIRDLRAVDAIDGNGDLHSFTMYGVYKIGETFYTDVINGYTCLPLKNCIPCASNALTIAPFLTHAQLITADSIAFVTGQEMLLGMALNDTCEPMYGNFLYTLSLYNDSEYAQYTGDTLDEYPYTFEEFVDSGFCVCVGAYINYLTENYIEQFDSTLMPPLTIAEFGPCNNDTLLPPPVDSCALRYAEYTQAIEDFNAWAEENGFEYTITQVLTEAFFVQQGYCHCLDKYKAFLQAIMDGIITDETQILNGLNITQTCNDIKVVCKPLAPKETTATPFFTKFDNPCAEQLRNIAITNAESRYNEYIDSLTTVISALYNSHCLRANENYTVRYDDKEHHFTLYYYDQSGNLVRTVPPEGVNPLSITSYADAIAQNIITDRTNNTHTVFTDHHLYTTYEYNSLNQLVKESLPDHDKINVWELSLPNGLDSRLKITSSHFINETRGYLTGYVDLGNSAQRGYLYTTADGGTTWTRVNGTPGVNINKIQMVNDTGYAVCDKGVFLRTLDGGASWDLFNTYNLNVSVNLNALHFINGKTGVIVGEQGRAFKVSNAGSTLSSASLSSILNLTSVTYDGSNYYITAVDTGGLGRIYKSSNGTSWTQQTSIRESDIARLNFVGTGSTVFAAGPDGLLMKSTDAGLNWKAVNSHTAKNIRDIAFVDASHGIAIIDPSTSSGQAGSTQGQIYTTINGGKDWTQLSAAGEYYNSIYIYQTNKAIVSGNNGLVKRVVYNSTTNTFGIINISPAGVTQNFTTAWAIPYTGGLLALAAGNGKDIYLSHDAGLAVPTWTTVSNTSVTGTNPVFKKISASDVSTALSGVAITDSGKIFSLYKATLSSPASALTLGAFTTPAPADQIINDVSLNAAADTLYAIEKFDGNLTVPVYKIGLKSSGHITAVTNTTNGVSFLNTAIEQSAVSTATIVTAGALGSIQQRRATASTWSTRTYSTTPLALRDIITTASNKLMASGDKGNILITTDGSNWERLISGVNENLNTIAAAGADTLTAGSNGALYNIMDVTPPAQLNKVIQLQAINSGTTNNINDVAIKTVSSINRAYITADNGTLNYISNLSNPTVTPVSVQTGGVQMNGVSFTSSGTAIAIGDNTTMFNASGATGVRVKELFTPKLNDVHFNGINGFIVGLKGTIRYTTDGGATWSAVIPAVTPTTIGATPYDIVEPYAAFTHSTGRATIAGIKNYIALVNNNTLTQKQLDATATTLRDIDFKGNKGYVTGTKVVSGVNYASYNYTSNEGTSWGSPVVLGSSTGFNGVHVFNNGNAIAVGPHRTIRYLSGTSNVAQAIWPSQAGTGSIFNDVFFHDDKNGYVCSDKGLLIRSTGDIFANSTTTGDSVIWVAQKTKDNFGVTDSLLIDIKTIGFAKRYNGFMGGAWNTATSTPNYARLIHDESFMFSVYHWYDKLGRLIISQNSRQYVSTGSANNKYSYTLYDELGRITEVGEKTENNSGVKFSDIFGEYVSGYYNPNVINDDTLTAWVNNSGARKEVTKTYYDVQAILDTTILHQENLRKRVATATYEDVFDGNDTTYQHATHYSYDIHGNVNVLLQDNLELENVNASLASQRYKRIDYDYDLISGKVNRVYYQNGKADAFHHLYEYDADNRITAVRTAKTTALTGKLIANSEALQTHLTDKDAKYFYYAHGPLARTETGDNQVQGMDYVYTLQGWIKGVNSNTLYKTRDPGADGLNSQSPNPNSNFAQDIYAYSLSYFENDYMPIDTSKWNDVKKRFEANKSPSDLLAARNNLFNGNISAMVTTLTKPDTVNYNNPFAPTILPLGNAYKYDQLNRIIDSRSFINIDTTLNKWNIAGSPYNGMYQNTFAYDANGNINKQVRKDELGKTIEYLTYRYNDVNGKRLQNRLYHVNDTVSAGAYNDDIDDQGTFVSNPTSINTVNNYGYDGEGRMIRDSLERIDTIKWTVYGKVKEVIRPAASGKKNLRFDYDATGNRIAKHVYTANNDWEKTDYYTRDAQGNTISIYSYIVNDSAQTASYAQIERNIYGSSRLATDNYVKEMVGALASTDTFNRYLGYKHFEASNHLGNISSTYSDIKIPLDNSTNDTIDAFVADVRSATDFSPFGAPLRLRRQGFDEVRYSINSQEKTDEISGSGNHTTAMYWEYDTRLGKRWNLDPVVKYHESPYACFANNPVNYTDLAGNDTSEVYTAGGSAEAFFAGATKTAKQGDKLTVHAGLTLTSTGKSVYTQTETRIYHAGNEYAEAGWYEEEDYTYANLDYAGGQILPPAKWYEFGTRYIGGDPKYSSSGYGVDQAGYLTGEYSYGVQTLELPWYIDAGPGKVKNIWKVGLYKDLRGVEAGLDAHHAGQAAIMEKLIPGYKRATAPAILVPRQGHTAGIGVLSRSLHGITNPRQLLARDIMELRRVYGKAIPNSALQELINLNKQVYPNAFNKL